MKGRIRVPADKLNTIATGKLNSCYLINPEHEATTESVCFCTKEITGLRLNTLAQTAVRESVNLSKGERSGASIQPRADCGLRLDPQRWK
ncbi:hypothetical protein J6590_018408 [Homalodisca vitripennis]|nr:hypothetical protein J6590_018408 [Homalodisca vitripennis]